MIKTRDIWTLNQKEKCMTTKKKQPKAPIMEEGFQKTNPRLHMLYTKTAVKHLTILDRMILELGSLSNLNVLDAQTALHEERQKLVKTNPAYADAQEILNLRNEGVSGPSLTEMELEIAYNER